MRASPGADDDGSLPPAPVRPSPANPRHRPLSEVAVSFGDDAPRYARTRPGYPPALVEVVTSPPGPPPREPEPREAAAFPREPLLRPAPIDVLDVGIGTGAAAEVFRDAGCRVTGVDPDERMAALARRAGFHVEPGTFDAWDPAGREFDVVVSGQAWHWVRQRPGAVKAAAALRDGGRLAVFWNVCLPEPDVAAALADVYRGVDLGLDFVPWERSPLRGYERLAGAATAGIWASRAFGPVTRHDLRWDREYTPAEWADHVPTLAWHDRLAPDALSRVQEANAAVVERAGGRLRMPYVTLTLTADRLPA